jgi:hypothetical protein
MTGHYGRGPGLKLLAEAVAAIALSRLQACRGQAAKGKGRVGRITPQDGSWGRFLISGLTEPQGDFRASRVEGR